MRCIRFDVCNQEIWYILYASIHVFYMLIYFAKHRITLLPLLPKFCTTHLHCLRLCFASSRMCPTLDRFGLLDGCLHNCWRITSQTPTFPIKLIPQANVIVFFYLFFGVQLTDVIRHLIRKHLIQHTAITFYAFKTHTCIVTFSQSHKI